ncbi:hypothetical protein [Streptomyces sp. NPDC029554]|uniref:hypothetical protein n=1 Tax=Streptomyces sp. NPDC029554 TaxID=3155126 RepID=UPI0033DD83C6
MTNEQREHLRGWFAGRLPDGLFKELTEVTVDREEITVIGRIPAPGPAEDVPDAPERQVLDTWIAGGVARSRSDALAWCVRLVRHHTDDWPAELRDSLEHVQRVRARGPDAGPEDRHPDDRE